MANTPWTQDRIIGLLERSDLAVERALVTLYDRQTNDEKADSCTKHDNRRGFRKNHDHTGSFFARIILKGWKQDGNKDRVHLNPYKLAKARGIVLHYSRQLCEEANAKQAVRAGARVNPRGQQLTAAEIDAQEDRREARKAAMEDHNSDLREPPVGSWASVARIMAQGDDSGFDWDAWKDQMKEQDMEDAPPSGEPV